MSVQALIEQARSFGVELRLVSGKVQAIGTQGDVARLIEPLRQHKADLLRWLTQRANDDQVRSTGPTPDSDPDRHCWPNSAAMTGREIITFTALLARLTDKGLKASEAEAMAGKVTQRDRESGDWYSCFECIHLAGTTGFWHCDNWRRAGVALRSRDDGIANDFVRLIQHCNGFKGAMT